MIRTRALLVAGLVVSLLLAGVVSYYASGDPDGLNKVAADQGFAAAEEEHDLAGGPLAGYEVAGVGDGRVSGGLAGVLGVTLTFALGSGLFLLARRTRPAGGVETDRARDDEPQQA